MYAGPPGSPLKNKRLRPMRPVPDKGRDARRDALLKLQAYNLGVLDTPASRRNFAVAGKNATRFEKSGRMALLQNADDGTLGVAPIVVGYEIGKALGIKIGSKYTKSTHAKRFADAQAKGDVALARSLIGQAWDHVRLGHPGGWPEIWQGMLSLARDPLLSDMRAKEGSLVAAPVPGIVMPPPIAIAPPPFAPPVPGTNVAVVPASPGFNLDSLFNFLKPSPAPAPAPGGDYAPPPDVKAAPVQAGMGMGFDSKTVMILAGVGIGGLLLSRLAGGGRRRRR